LNAIGTSHITAHSVPADELVTHKSFGANPSNRGWMRGYGDMEDLLRRQRRRRGWWRGVRRVLLTALLAGVAGYYWLYVRSSEPEQDVDERAKAVANVRDKVHTGIEAAERPLEVDAPKGTEGTGDPALTATWKKGEAVTMRGELEQNQSVFQALGGRDVPRQEIQRIVDATSEKFDFRKSRPGDEWTAEVEESGEITRFRYETSPEEVWETVRNSTGSYSVTKVDVPVQKRRTTLSGRVDKSLWQSMNDNTRTPEIIYRFADIFAYSVDFNRETKPGDSFAMVLEEVYLEGEFLRYGKILAAEYVNKGEPYRGYLYEIGAGDRGYYDETGKNLKRQFLKSPLASIRVTSTYGMRHHPVQGKKKMHRGVDYGAPIGTPIRAVAGGTVTYAGRKGANGNLIVLDHANGFTTLYAHLHSISDGIHAGAKVSKKTVIGEVGNTGRSTGAHLHFGMKRHGNYVDPQEVEFARAEPLEGDQREEFLSEVVEPLSGKLDELSLVAGADGSDDSEDQSERADRASTPGGDEP
jgi:murein DD-endopeptidase MepM/ murein hydrolase activator NlpD